MANKGRKRASSFSTRDYVKAISQHARQPHHSTLYPGFVYEGLSGYLQGPPLSTEGRRTATGAQTGTRYDACLYALDLKSTCTPATFTNVGVCLETLHNNIEESVPQILFLNGYTCPRWLTGVASALAIEPEFLNSNMRFRCIRNYHSFPGLPSAYENIIRLRVVTIGSRETVGARNSDPKLVKQLRDEARKQMVSYRHNLQRNRDVCRGDSIVREYQVLSERHFFLEQEISINVSLREGTWTALVLSDIGSSLSKGSKGPWLSISDLSDPRSNVSKTKFYPTIVHRRRIAFRAVPVSSDIQDATCQQFPQTASLLALDYGRLLKRSAMSSDPFYALHDLFLFAASSENQFLNLMDSYVGNVTGHTVLNDKHPTLSDLRYYQDILEAHVERLGETIKIIQLRGCSRWPRAAQDHEHFARVEASADWLLRDYEYLQSRALAIRQRCDRGMNVIMNDMNLTESKRAITQAGSVKRLTFIAFVYIPLSFTTSLFGMNVRQLGSGEMPLWVWVATSVLVLMLTVAVFFVDIDFVKRLFRLRGSGASNSMEMMKGDAIV